jgi:hypothetical protein
MSMLQVLEIKDNGTTLLLDGEPIKSVLGYKIKRSVDCVPLTYLTVTIMCKTRTPDAADRKDPFEYYVEDRLVDVTNIQDTAKHHERAEKL